MFLHSSWCSSSLKFPVVDAKTNAVLLDARLKSQGLNESLWHCWIILWHQCFSLMMFMRALTLWVHVPASWWVSQLLYSDLWNKDATVTETRSLWNVPASHVCTRHIDRLGTSVDSVIFAFLLVPPWACIYFSMCNLQTAGRCAIIQQLRLRFTDLPWIACLQWLSSDCFFLGSKAWSILMILHIFPTHTDSHNPQFRCLVVFWYCSPCKIDWKKKKKILALFFFCLFDTQK